MEYMCWKIMKWTVLNVKQRKYLKQWTPTVVYILEIVLLVAVTTTMQL